jgi:F-type H+-transporting ATPase subunit epsilon
MKLLHLTLLSIHGTLFDQEISSLSCITSDGEITIMADHMPIVTACQPGHIVIFDNENKKHIFATSGGMIQIHDNHLSLLVEEATHFDNITEETIQRAEEEARRLIEKHKHETTLDDKRAFAHANAQLSKTLAESHTWNKYTS